MRNANSICILLTALALAACAESPGGPVPPDPQAQIQTISHGQAVTLEDHLVDGKWTVVEFYADW